MANVVYGAIDFKPEGIKSRFHSLEDHNYWVGRGYVCPYCLIGSEPVPKCIIEEESG